MSNLSKRERLRLLNKAYEIENEHCNKCKDFKSVRGSFNPEKVCAGCPFYQELRNIGDQMCIFPGASEKIEVPFTYEEYQGFRAQEMTRDEIADKFNVTLAQLKKYLNVHYHRRGRKNEKIRENQAQKVSG